MNKKKIYLTIFVSLVFLLISIFLISAEQPTVENIILLIPDGMSVGNVTLTRWFMNGENLSWDQYVCALVKTYSADAPIADSAPAGTAMATGKKSHTGYISVLPDIANMPGQKEIPADMKKAPLVTILEAAKLIGKSTGLVATSNIQHATPAVFAAHWPDRNNYEAIAEQILYNNVDVLMGAGLPYFKERKDKENLFDELIKRNYKIAENKEQFLSLNAGKVAYLDNSSALPYDIDRDEDKIPSIAEMTQKAIEILSKNKNGFFLMVEGSKIDWANHANEPVGVMSDILAFNEAVKVALNYARNLKNTVVIVVADHSTGGFSSGNSNTSKDYDKRQLTDFVLPLKLATVTGEGLEKILLSTENLDTNKIKETIAKYYYIKDLTDEELKTIENYINEAKANPKKAGSFNYIIGPMISKRANIGWTSNGHVGEDVALAIYNPTGYRLSGVVENSDIALYMSKIFNVDLDKLTKKYFINAKTVAKSVGADFSIDQTDIENPISILNKGNIEVKIPANKDYIFVNGKIQFTKLLNVYNGSDFFISDEIINIFVKK